MYIVPFPRPKGAGRFCRGGRPRAAVRGAGALRMRHTPCGCCPPDRAAGAELFSGFTGGSVFAVTPQLSLRGHSSSQASYPSPRRKRQVSSIALLVLSKQQTLRWFAVWSHFCLARKKVCKKEALDAFYSAYAQKNRSLHCACCRSSFRSPNALRATFKSGFLTAR